MMTRIPNILLAEDDKNFGLILKNELEGKRLHVDLVTDGAEAILNFLSKAYDFVLLDIRMPRLNGTDALRILKKINPRIPVITLSGDAGVGESTESINAGAIKCLFKPFEIARLNEDIQHHLQKEPD